MRLAGWNSKLLSRAGRVAASHASYMWPRSKLKVADIHGGLDVGIYPCGSMISGWSWDPFVK